MNQHKQIEGKLWNAIVALTSGVLTNLIYNEISSTSYVLEFLNGQYTLIQVNNNAWEKIGLIFLTFFLVWAFISTIIPVALRIRQKIAYQKINRINNKNLTKSFDSAKNETLILLPFFVRESTEDVPNPDLALLHVKDLANVVTKLHNIFKPHNNKLQKQIRNYFRNPNHSSIINIGDNISDYEFSALITLLLNMVERVQSLKSDNKLLQKDCDEMLKSLKEMEEYCKPTSLKQ